jgi:UDP-N-acetylglucosamine 2-epimerase
VKKIVLIAQGRAGFLQLAPLYAVLKKNAVLDPVFVRTVRKGEEHLLNDLSGAFGIAGPDYTAVIRPGSPVGETAALMVELENILAAASPVLVVPGGCDNAALAAALVSAKLGIPVASIDAGLRSYDRTESDEINRMVIDSIAMLHFVSEHSGIYNLMNEGMPDEKIIFTGNTAIDSLVELIGRANASGVLNELDIEPKKFVTVLLREPFHPATKDALELMIRVLSTIAATTTVLFPCCTGMESMMKKHKLHHAFSDIPGLRIIEPPGYIEMLRLLKESAFVLTDTDEYQAELTVMNVPCLSMRDSTARPSTIEVGTNVLVGFDEQAILEQVSLILSGKPRSKTLIPEKWDGASSGRIAAVLERIE